MRRVVGAFLVVGCGVLFLYDPLLGAVDLDTLISNRAPWQLYDAFGINDNNWIVGEGENPSGLPHAFLATPVP